MERQLKYFQRVAKIMKYKYTKLALQETKRRKNLRRDIVENMRTQERFEDVYDL